jgi:hypothetical protein
VAQEGWERIRKCQGGGINSVKTMKEAQVKKTTFYKLVKEHESTLNKENI